MPNSQSRRDLSGAAWAGLLLMAAMLSTEVAVEGSDPSDSSPAHSRARQKGESADGEGDPFGFFNTQQELEMEHLIPERWLKPLTDRGIDYVAIYTSELLGNVRGGMKRGVTFSGVLEAGVSVETEGLFGWSGGTFYASTLISHGPSLSEGYVGDLYSGSSIESESTIRLFEAWFDQSFADEAVSLRVGQLAVDREFLGTDLGTLFINAAFGWPAVFGLGVDAPTYPVAAPGARLRIDLSHFWMQAGVFTGQPEPVNDDGETLDRHGLYANFDRGAFVIWEAGYSTATDDETSDYPAVYKLGGWLHTGKFEDRQYDDTGLSLADPFSSQNPRELKNNSGFYSVAEQKIWRPADAIGEQGLSLFARGAASPDDRNPVSFSVDGGLHYVGLLPGRARDITGLGISYSQISARARALVRDNNVYTVPPVPLPDYESALEFTHRIEIRPWWFIQPDFQYIMHPGGSRAIQNAFVIGLRSTLSF